MSGRNFASYAPMDQRLIDAERELAYLQRMVDALMRSRDPRIIEDSGQIVPAILNAVLNAQGHASASFMTLGAGPVLTPGPSFTVYDWMMNPGDSIDSGARIWVAEWQGFWWVVVPYCSTDAASPPATPIITPPPPPDPNLIWPALRNYQQFVSQSYSTTSSGMNQDNDSVGFP